MGGSLVYSPFAAEKRGTREKKKGGWGNHRAGGHLMSTELGIKKTVYTEPLIAHHPEYQKKTGRDPSACAKRGKRT